MVSISMSTSSRDSGEGQTRLARARTIASLTRSGFSASSWLARRFLSAMIVVLSVTAISFFLLDRLPGDAARQLLGPNATPLQVRALEEKLDLARPVAERYEEWLTGALRGHMGRSIINHQSVASLLLDRIPVTAELVVGALVVAIVVAVFAALCCARFQGHLLDRLCAILSLASISTASFIFAVLLVLVFSVHWHLFPAIGFVPLQESAWANIHSLALPLTAIALPLAGFYTRFLRADLLEQLSHEEYILTARAKGLGPWAVLTRHALRNSIAGLITLVAVTFGALLGGSVVIEQMFALPGMGTLLLQSVTIRDAPVVQGIVVLLGIATVLANLISDIICKFIDPRRALR